VNKEEPVTGHTIAVGSVQSLLLLQKLALRPATAGACCRLVIAEVRHPSLDQGAGHLQALRGLSDRLS